MLTINNLNKKFGSFIVLDSVNLHAEPGQIYGLVGSNGCGKTTLLKHIMHIYKQDSGLIEYDGGQLNKDSIVHNDFYYVQDNIYFPYQYTLNKLYEYENLLYKNISREKFDVLVKYFNIDINKNLNKMSKGQRKQAAFVMAISVNPKVLLLDEIVDGLDAVIKRKFWEVLIKEVMENSMTVIISSHDLKELDNICDKIGIMHQGKIIKEENLEQMKSKIKRVQFAIEGDFVENKSDYFNIIRKVKIGSIYICTLTGDSNKFKEHLANNYKLILYDELSMNLEEIFITELGGAGYGIEQNKI